MSETASTTSGVGDAPVADPRDLHHTEGFPRQAQDQPGETDTMRPEPDHGEQSYEGHGRLLGRRALITGGDSGIGRAVAIAYAREGADVTIACLPEERHDAEETIEIVEEAGANGSILLTDLRDEGACEKVVTDAVSSMDGLDILVSNAGYQQSRDSLTELTTAEFDKVFKTNLYALLWLVRAALPHLTAGSSIIVTSSIQAFQPSPGLVDYAMTKAAQVAFVKAMATSLGPHGIRVNAVAPGPIWTPLIPGTDWPDKVESFGQDTPLGRAGQPAELAGAYVYLASGDASYVSGAVVPVTGGRPL